MKSFRFSILSLALIFSFLSSCGKKSQEDDESQSGLITDSQATCPIIDESFPDEVTIDIEEGAAFLDESRELKDVGTTFVVKEFFENSSSLYNFMSLVYTGIDKVLADYKEENDLAERSMFLLFKGGNVLRVVANGYYDLLPPAYRDFLKEEYGTYFKRSDADFSIYVDEDFLPDGEYETVFEDVSQLAFEELDRIRDVFELDPDNYFDFLKLKPEYATKTLKSYYETLNSLNSVEDQDNEKWYSSEFTELSLDDLSSHPEDTCFYKGEYDYKFTVSEEGSAIDRSTQSDESSWIYNSNNQTLTWSWGSDETKIVKFYLVRSKVAFQYQYERDNESLVDIIGGELIDVSLPRKEDSRLAHMLANYDDSVQVYTLVSPDGTESVDLKAYSLAYLAEDLEFIIFDSFIRPWKGGGKYTKRVYRLFFLYLMNQFKSLDSQEDREAYLAGSSALVSTLKSWNGKKDIGATFAASVDALVDEYPDVLMNQFWLGLSGFLERMIADSLEDDKENFSDFLDFVQENIDNGEALIDGSLTGVVDFKVKDLYTAEMSRLL